MRAELLEEIAAVLQDEHRSVLFSSHITQDVEQVADYVAIVGDGRLVDFAKKRTLARWKRIPVPFVLRSLFRRWQRCT